jgi:ArsR family transcriptional regulator, arsenate/arsenite/antimonite-responsive transcriptional repressor
MEMVAALEALGALAQGSRLSVFRLLVERGPDGLPAGQIAEELDIPSATLSFHLGQLSQAGLVTSTRNGRSIVYAADYKGMDRLMGFLYENCCQGACVPAAAVRRVKRKEER